MLPVLKRKMNDDCSRQVLCVVSNAMMFFFVNLILQIDNVISACTAVLYFFRYLFVWIVKMGSKNKIKER
jgi:hypothetical protein